MSERTLRTLRIVRAGPFTTVQDLGRRGRGHQGVARAGAFDLGSHLLANRLVGNASAEATLEVLLGPFECEARHDLVMAVTGTNAEVTLLSDGRIRATSTNCAVAVRAGERVVIGVPTVGLRTYVSLRGGLQVGEVLGSRSYDSLGLIGPPPLQDDDELEVGEGIVGGEPGGAWFETVPIRPPADASLLDLRLGPRQDFLSAVALSALGSLVWTVDAASNRTGVRFAGPVLDRRTDELASEAMIPGAVQLPLSGLPIVLGPDGGTTGGYPVIGVISRAGLNQLAQRRPGDPVRFRIMS